MVYGQRCPMSEALASHQLDLMMSCTVPGLSVVPVSHMQEK